MMAIKNLRLAVFLGSLVQFASHAFGHGESQRGPHGGSIRMPAAFHIELTIDQSSRVIRVYILDMNFKALDTDGSDVAVSYTHKAQKENLSCLRQKAFFECPAPRKINLEVGSLAVESKMSGQKGAQVAYDLPLRIDISH